MRIILTYLLLAIITLAFFSCKKPLTTKRVILKDKYSQNASSDTIVSKDKLTRNFEMSDSVPLRFLPIKEQYKKADPFHTYGNIKLTMQSPLTYVYENFEKD